MTSRRDFLKTASAAGLLAAFAPTALFSGDAQARSGNKMCVGVAGSEVGGLDVKLLFDNSGSMSDEIKQAINSAQSIMQNATAMYGNNVRFGVGAFGRSDPRYVRQMALTSDAAQVARGIQSCLQSSGSREIAGSAMLNALQENDWNPNVQNVIILYTDEPGDDSREINQAVRLARSKGTSLIGVISEDSVFPTWERRMDVTLPLGNALNLEGMTLRGLMQVCGDYPEAHFETAKYALDGKDKTELKKLADFVKAKSKEHGNQIGVQVQGHADHRGSDVANYLLGMRRAREAARYLNKQGVLAAAVSYGESRPMCQTSEDWCLAQNRRAHLYPVNMQVALAQDVDPIMGPRHERDMFFLAGVRTEGGREYAVYSKIPTSRRDNGSNIARDFNYMNAINGNHLVNISSRNVFYDPEMTQRAGSNIRMSQPVYIKAEIKK